MYDRHEYGVRRVSNKAILDECKPHWGIAAAIIAAATAAYSAQQSAKAKQRNKRNTANAAQMAQGGVDAANAPTAYKFAGESGGERGGGGARLGDMLGQAGTSGISEMASPKEQGFSLGLKSLDADIPEKSFGFDTGAPGAATEMEVAQKTMPVEKVGEAQAAKAPAASGGGGGADYASIASSLIQAYQASQTAKPQPGPLPQLGPMNTKPTAYQFGIPR